MIPTLAPYSPLGFDRTITDSVIPIVPPTGSLSRLIDDCRSTSSEIGAVRLTREPTEGPGIVITPAPPLTEALPARPVRVQDPPRSAVPQPEATVRPKSSDASSEGAGGAVTVTVCVTDPEAPWSSVTVSV